MIAMSEQEFVAGDQVWPTLKRLARRSSGSNRVAVAYLGDGAGDFLRLGKGDVLIVDLSEANAKNGSVSPHEVSRLMDRGVEVFVADKLHPYLCCEICHYKDGVLGCDPPICGAACAGAAPPRGP